MVRFLCALCIGAVFSIVLLRRYYMYALAGLTDAFSYT